jgi:GT2 family glycosyltransferase
MTDAEADSLAAEIDRLRRAVAGLEALLGSRDQRIRRLRDRLRDARLQGLWLDGEVARRDAEIGELRRAASRPGLWRSLAGKLTRVLRRARRARVQVDPIPPPPPPRPAPAPAPVAPGGAEVLVDSPSIEGGSPQEPFFSILLWGDGEPAEATFASLRAQTYPAWEVVPAPEDLAAARGLYLIPLEAGDLMEPDGLRRLAEALMGNDPPDLVYWDERGTNGHPDRLKPGWSPVLLLSEMYLGRSLAIRRDRFNALGGYRAGFGAARHHDLVLRMAEGRARVAHLPWCLTRPRSFSGPCPAAEIDLGTRAIREALERRRIDGWVSRPRFALAEGKPIFQIDFPEDGPRVALVIPTRDRVDLLRRCVGSILDRTTYRPFRVVVVDNDSSDPETLRYLEELPARDVRCEVVRISNEGRPFSYARVNNLAVAGLGESDEFVVFLNNDTEVLRPEWLGQMVGHGRMPGVGAVGARLLFPDGRVQHAGMAVGLEGGLPGHLFKLAPWWHRGDLDGAVVARECSAVTAACLLTRRSVFLEMGGFDESRFAVAFNDVDYCLRLGRSGLRSIYAPRAELLHHEGATRGFGDDPAETGAYLAAWGHLIDPYMNPCWRGAPDRGGQESAQG